jgi:myo-inositol 2-dehydrogenase/D-chiro-inositol 1-dehydrogenase
MSEINTTRRDFLKVAGASALAAVALPQVHAAGSDVIRVGVIGCGGRGKGAADNVLNAAPGVKIVAIGDVFQFRVDDARKTILNAAQKADPKKLCNSAELPEDRCFVGLDCHERVINAGVDYVILASPPGFRPMHLQAAVAAGKTIFTEKPVAVDGPGIRKVLAAHEESLKKGLAIAAGTQRRHQNGYLETIRRIHDGAIGDIVAARCYWNNQGIWFRKREDLAKLNVPDSDLAYQMHNWYHFVWTCGDNICEQHVHNLDVINWAMRKHPKACFGVGCRTGSPNARPAGEPSVAGHIFDQFSIEYDYGDGVHMHSMCRQVPGTAVNFPGLKGESEALVGTKGTCQVDAYKIRSGKDWEYTGTGNAPYVQEHTDLIDSLRKGKPINELQGVAESTLTAIMGRMAAYTGKLVTWDQALNSKEDTFPTKLSWDMTLPVPPVAVPGVTKLV